MYTKYSERVVQDILTMSEPVNISKFLLAGYTDLDRIFYFDYHPEYMLILNRYPEMLERVKE